jgi:DNA-binding GntR family transcriptional regulator
MEHSITRDSDRPVFSKLAQASLARQALDSIRQAIINGDLKPDEPLRESSIASQMGISRAPVREALLILEEEGFVERIPHKGTYVTSFSKHDVEELYSLRTVLECFGIELLVERMDDKDIQYLQSLLDKMRQGARAGNARRVNDYDLAIHEYLMKRSGHKRLLSVWRGLKSQIRRILIAGNLLNEDLDQVVENHVPLFHALEARDAVEAKRLIEQHVSDVGERVIANWADIESASERVAETTA